MRKILKLKYGIKEKLLTPDWQQNCRSLDILKHSPGEFWTYATFTSRDFLWNPSGKTSEPALDPAKSQVCRSFQSQKKSWMEHKWRFQSV